MSGGKVSSLVQFAARESGFFSRTPPAAGAAMASAMPTFVKPTMKEKAVRIHPLLRLLVALASLSTAVAPASATVTVQGFFGGIVGMTRVLTLSDNPSLWPFSCRGQPTCIFTDSYFRQFGDQAIFSSDDGIHFTATEPASGQGFVTLGGRGYRFYSTGSWTADLTKTGPYQYQITDFQRSMTLLGQGIFEPRLTFTGTAQSNGYFRGGFDVAPEPATWAMMLIGFGAIGLAMRRRNCRRTEIPAA